MPTNDERINNPVTAADHALAAVAWATGARSTINERLNLGEDRAWCLALIDVADSSRAQAHAAAAVALAAAPLAVELAAEIETPMPDWVGHGQLPGLIDALLAMDVGSVTRLEVERDRFGYSAHLDGARLDRFSAYLTELARG